MTIDSHQSLASIDRYLDIGLLMNPFAAELARGDYRNLFVDRGLPDPPPAGAATLVQVIGDKGAGKTTQVLAWRQRTSGPYHYVPPSPYRQRWANPPVGAIVYADEIDRMPGPLRWSWFRRLARNDATVVAGTHLDLTGAARRAGLRVITHVLGPADPMLMRQVFDRRFEQVELGPPTVLRFDMGDVREIHRRSQGSLRRAEVIGHEIVAARAFNQFVPQQTRS